MANKRINIKMAVLTHTGTGTTIDTSEIPDVSYEALLVYGYNHFMGNVQQAKRTNRIRSMLAEEQDVKPSAITTDAVKAWTSTHPSEAKAMLDEFAQEALVELRNGTVGVREGKPRVDEATKRFNREVFSRFNLFLKGQGLAVEKDESHVYAVRGADGTVHNRTRDQLIAGLVERKGEEIRAKVAADMAKEGETAANDFGLV